MNETKRRGNAKEKTDPAAVTINGMMITNMIVDIAAAVFVLLCGVLYRSDWMIMLAISFTLTACARGYLLLPARRSEQVRNKIRGYQKYKLSGMILSVLYLVLLLFIVVKRKEGFFYPVPVLIVICALAVYKILAMVMDFRAFSEADGPYTAGLRILDLVETVFAVLLLIQIVFAAASGAYVASGMVWILSAVVSCILLLASIYMVVFADGEIRLYSERAAHKQQ